ncbi:MAG: hypothetical protein R3358_04435 [Woeseiaceae bacterium]|nr:hypothetical protein [Woeseiaceae bacterium]
MQQQISNSNRGPLGTLASRFGAVLAMASLLALSACSGSQKDVNETDQTTFGPDGVPPTLTTVSIQNARDVRPKPDGKARLGQTVRVNISASEALKKPVVTINGVAATVTGKVNGWRAERAMTDADADGEVSFSITYEDISGEAGTQVTATTDGSVVQYCRDGCPDSGSGSLAGDWSLDGVGSAGVGPAPGDVSWWSLDDAGVVTRACWLDDIYRFGDDGSFNQILGDETWLEPFQGVAAESCGTPVAPHDGSTTGTWNYNEIAGELTINGTGLHLGLAKVVNGAELSDPAAAPASIIYQVETLDAETLVVTIEAIPGNWWTFRFKKAPVSPLLGKWVLDGEGSAGVGPAAGDVSWWSLDAAGVVTRACWLDDIYEFNADGSFRNVLGDETWLEPFQGVAAESCGAPVAPHDGSNPAIFEYDDVASTLTLFGKGAHLGLAKVVNGAELSDPAAAPESITYDVSVLDGDTLTVTIEAIPGNWWTFRFNRVSNSPLVGKWRLAGEGSAGVGPAPGDVSWWSLDAAGVVTRACWLDDIYHFGSGGTFRNFVDDETWLEPFQGVAAESCGAPVAPHDGSSTGSFDYDEAASTLTINGRGSHLGLAKVVNGAELSDPAAAPDSITYDVVTLDGDNMTVTIEAIPGNWWTFVLERVNDTAALRGKWVLDGEGSAGVGPAAGDVSWWSLDAAGVVTRACWLDDVYAFNRDGSFEQVLGDETWLEPFQGVAGESCGAPVAPHDGSNPAIFVYDSVASTLKLSGRGAHIGLAKVVNGAELSDPAAAPESITYDVSVLDGDTLTVTIEAIPGNWWTFRLNRASSSPLVGNWKLDGEGSAGVGPASGDISWWGLDAAGVVTRACWLDDVIHFGAGGNFQNFMGGDTWLEPFQGVAAESCGTPVAPHDGSTTGSFSYDEVANTLTLNGRGSHLGLAKVVNGAELADPAAAPDAITYDVVTLDGGVMTVTIEAIPGNWWTFRYTKN